MGIKNKNNAMYFATGIDNSGLSEDAEQGKKIVRDMTDDIVAEGSKMRDAFAKAGTGVVSITDKIKELKIGINQTEADIKTLQNTFENAAPGKAKMFALQELEAAKKVLQEDKIALQELETQMKKTSTGPISLRTQIRNLKEQMALNPGKNYTINVTGGKKSMVASAAIFGRDYSASIIYIDYDIYDPNLRRPLPGTEKMNIVYSPYLNLPELFH